MPGDVSNRSLLPDDENVISPNCNRTYKCKDLAIKIPRMTAQYEIKVIQARRGPPILNDPLEIFLAEDIVQFLKRVGWVQAVTDPPPPAAQRRFS